MVGHSDSGPKYLDILTLEASVILERLPCSLECKPLLHHLLVLRILESGDHIHNFSGHIVTYCNTASVHWELLVRFGFFRWHKSMTVAM